jgi:hypothetical protein
MYTKSWHIIKDDRARTFEVITHDWTDNAFTNKVHAMQKEGMAITGLLQPVTNKFASKASITFIGYRTEEGLFERLLREHQQLLQRHVEDW